MARLTGLEPATPGVTGRYSNQLSYNRAQDLTNLQHGAVDGTRTRDLRRAGLTFKNNRLHHYVVENPLPKWRF